MDLLHFMMYVILCVFIYILYVLIMNTLSKKSINELIYKKSKFKIYKTNLIFLCTIGIYALAVIFPWLLKQKKEIMESHEFLTVITIIIISYIYTVLKKMNDLGGK